MPSAELANLGAVPLSASRPAGRTRFGNCTNARRERLRFVTVAA